MDDVEKEMEEGRLDPNIPISESRPKESPTPLAKEDEVEIKLENNENNPHGSQSEMKKNTSPKSVRHMASSDSLDLKTPSRNPSKSSNLSRNPSKSASSFRGGPKRAPNLSRNPSKSASSFKNGSKRTLSRMPSRQMSQKFKKREPLLTRIGRYITMYQILFTLCICINIVFIALAASLQDSYFYKQKSAFALGNILACIMIRNEVILFGLYWIVVKLFQEWPPLWFRNFLTSFLLHIGGCHSSLAISGTMWIIYIIVDLQQHRSITDFTVRVVSFVLGGLLLLSSVGAFPLIRFYFHNSFEKIHRFSGWSALATLWVFVVLANNYNVYTQKYEFDGKNFYGEQTFWFCVAITLFIIQPWLLTREIPVLETIVPSKKICLLKFEGAVPPGYLARISRKPILEWHAFGVISEGPESGVHYFLVTALGDFTRALITDPPRKVYTRIFKFVGLPYCVPLYKMGVGVCTGSGLGITMSLMLQGKKNFHLVWVARELQKTFGDVVMGMLARSDQDRLHMYDSVKGRPDVLKITIDLVKKVNGECVFVTSNRTGTRYVIEGCRAAGIPAFGPIFDS